MAYQLQPGTYIIETISADMYEAFAPKPLKTDDIKLPDTKAIPQIGSKICKAMVYYTRCINDKSRCGINSLF